MTQPLRGRAGQVLLSALFELAEQREDVREALLEVGGMIRARLGATRARGSEVDELPDKVLQPRRSPRSAEGGEERPLREVQLDRVVDRARWKADACRFVVHRRRGEAPEGRDLVEMEQDLRTRRDPLEDCFAWMLDTHRRLPDDERMLAIAECYENVSRAAARTLELERESLLEPSPPGELLYLLAEAQSALLSSLSEVDLRGDSDQRDLFLWLKDQTTRHRIYVDRHMRLDDPADFRRAPQLARRLEELVGELVARRDARRQRGQMLNRIRYHLRKVVENTPPPAYDVGAIEETVRQWQAAGLPASDRTLHHLLGSLRESMQGEGDLPDTVESVLDCRMESGAAETRPSRPELLARARSLLGGRRVLLFAASEDKHADQELREQLGLAELRWVRLEEGGEVESILRSEIAAGDAGLVLIALRLQVAEYALFKDLCIEHSRPFVRLPSGYGPMQVAHQVLRQVGRRLRSSTQESPSRAD